MTGEGDSMNETDVAAHADVDVLHARIARLEDALEETRAEASQLRLQLHVLTSTDVLTGLANRNGLLDSLQTAIDRLARYEEPFALALFSFPVLAKVIAVGDDAQIEEATRHLSALLAAGLRSLDRVGRLDDETFGVVLTNICERDVRIVLDRTMTALHALPVYAGDDEVPVEARVVVLAGSGDLEVTAGDVLDRCEVLVSANSPLPDPVIKLQQRKLRQKTTAAVVFRRNFRW